MSSVKVRFYGRFVFAEPLKNKKGVGTLNVLVANLQYNPDVCADPHDFLMTAPRTSVAVPGSRRPDSMLMSTLPSGDDNAELSLWRLRDFEVVIQGPNDFRWDTKDKLADVALLTKNQGRFDKNNLKTAGVFSAVHAVVRLATGIGTASQMDVSETVDFVKVDRTQTTLKDLPIADVVEVVIKLPKGVNNLVFNLANRSGGPAGSIVIVGGKDNNPTIVNFSNLCTALHEKFDDEFAGFYEVLENPGLLRERLIPAQTATEGLEFDCFKPIYVGYET